MSQLFFFLSVAEKLGMKNVPKVSDYAQYELENQSIQEPRPYLSFADQQREENRKKAESLASSSFLHPPPSNSLSTLDINHKVPVLPQDSDTTVTIDTSLPISQTVVEVLPVVRAIVEGKSFLSDIEVPLGFTENLNTSADFDDTNYDDLPGLEGKKFFSREDKKKNCYLTWSLCFACRCYRLRR